MTPRRQHVAAVAALLALTLSCATVTPFVATGEGIDYAGNQFANTAKLMDSALEAGTVPVETYRAWSEFGRRFQLIYPVALQSWEASRRMNDTAQSHDMLLILTQLVQELRDFYRIAFTAVSAWNPDGGMPWKP